MTAGPLRKYFITGLFILLPVIITIYILSFAFNFVDGLLQPFIKPIIGRTIPGLGLIVGLIVIFVTGLIATNVFGKKIIAYGESIVIKIPLVKQLYSATKQIIDAFSVQSQDAFQRVVLVEYPRKGIYAIGFVTGEGVGEVQALTEDEVANVFIPTTPNPTSGFLILFPKDQLIPLEMTIEEGLKMVISGGVVSPKYSKKEHIVEIKNPSSE